MGSGLSMASVNKIKELANAREYGLALDILDSQDLTKSLNPQFLRLCGEIYIYNKRYKDARHVLLIAHKLAPEAKRIIYTIMFLYLKMGYKDLAKQYYDMYMFDADENVLETKQVMYIYNKANKTSADDLEKYIAPTYSNTMDYEWTYETILLYLVQGRDKEAEGLIQIYSATFKESEHDITIHNIVDGKADAEAFYSSFADEECADDDLEQAADRELEAKLLDADDLRIHPREPEIVIMVDDNDDDEIVPKRKLKKMLKEQERKEKETEEESKEENVDTDVNQNTASGDVSDDKSADTDAQEVEDKATDDGETEGKMTDNDKTEEVNNNSDSADLVETQGDGGTTKGKKNFIKNIFSRSKKKEKTVDEEKDTLKEDEEAATTVEQVESDNEKTKEAEKEAYEEARNIFFGNDIEEDNSDKESTENESANADVDSESTDGDNDMREIHMKERNSIKKPIVTVDMGDDDFTAESDTIENLHDSEGFGNPFDSIVATKGDEAVPSYKVKKSISFETAELADVEDDDEYEVDDFSSLNEEEDEFGEMRVIEPEPEFEEVEEKLKSELEPEPEEVETEEIEPEVKEADVEIEESEPEFEPEPEVAEPEVEEIEEEPELDIEESEEELESGEVEIETEAEEVEEEIKPEIEPEPEEEAEPEIEPEPEEEAKSEIEPEVVEPEVEEIEEIEEEPELDIEESYKEPESGEVEIETEAEEVDEEIEPEIEPEEEAEPEIEPEVAESEVEEIEEEPELDIEESYKELESGEEELESEPDTEEEELEKIEPEEAEAEIEEVEPEVEEIEETPYSTYSEQEIDSMFKVPPKKKLDYPVFKSSLFPDYHNEEPEIENNFSEILQEAQDKIHENILKEEEMQREAEELLASLGIDLGNITVTSDNMDDENETFDDGPSRDELKASLKINSVQRDVLNKLKEYR